MSSVSLSATLLGHSERVWHVSWHPKLPILASCSGDSSVRVWAPSVAGGVDAAGGSWDCITVLDDFTTRTARCVEWSPCGRLLAVSSFDGTVTAWDVSGPALRWGGSAGASTRCVSRGSLRFKRAATLRGHDNEVKCITWSASGDSLATCGRDMSVWVWVVIDGEAEETNNNRNEDDDVGGSASDSGASVTCTSTDFECVAVLHGHDADVKCISFHPTDELLVSASYDDSLHSWAPDATADWAAVQKLPSAHASTVWSFAWAPDGARGASVGEDGVLKTWSAPAGTGAAPRTLTLLRVSPIAAHARTAYSVHWSPCGRFIVTGGADDAVNIFDAETLERVVTVHNAHAGDVNSVRWHSSGAFFASAGDDGAVKIWSWISIKA